MPGSVKRVDFKPVHIEKMVQLHKRGWTNPNIADLIGCSDTMVATLLKGHPDYNPRRIRARGYSRHTVEQAERVGILLKANVARKDIARRLRISVPSVWRLSRIAKELEGEGHNEDIG